MNALSKLRKHALFRDLLHCIPSLTDMRRVLLDILLFVVLWIGIRILSDSPYPSLFPSIPSQWVVHPVRYSRSDLSVRLEESPSPDVDYALPVVETTPLLQENQMLNPTPSSGFMNSTSVELLNSTLTASSFPVSRNDSEAILTERPLPTSPPSFPSETVQTSPPPFPSEAVLSSSNDTCGHPENPCDVVMTLSAECSAVVLLASYHLVVLHSKEDPEHPPDAVSVPETLLLQGSHVFHVPGYPALLREVRHSRFILLPGESLWIARVEEHASPCTIAVCHTLRGLHEQ